MLNLRLIITYRLLLLHNIHKALVVLLLFRLTRLRFRFIRGHERNLLRGSASVGKRRRMIRRLRRARLLLVLLRTLIRKLQRQRRRSLRIVSVVSLSDPWNYALDDCLTMCLADTATDGNAGKRGNPCKKRNEPVPSGSGGLLSMFSNDVIRLLTLI